jgi:Heterokaryon incompatibility protein (HET)
MSDVISAGLFNFGSSSQQCSPLLVQRAINLSPEIRYATYRNFGENGQALRLEKRVLTQILNQGFPFSQIPTRFREVMLLFTSIGLQYTWIDSICIIQDSPDIEWNSVRESTLSIGAMH